MVIFSHDHAHLHLVPTGHPERPERITTIYDMLDQEFCHIKRQPAPLASLAQLSLVHTDRYLDRLFANAPTNGLRGIDGDTYLSPDSLDVAKRAAGASCAAVDYVMAGKTETAFVAMRPPGHHAEPDRAMGFCFFSNAAIAAIHAQKTYGIERVAVLDFDVHHGNGTQAAFWDKSHCYYASSHEMPLFPGTGHETETGTGSIINQPLRSGMGGDDVLAAWRPMLQRLEAVGPELIIISAGFDAHKDDPLASLQMSASDFYELTSQIMTLAENTAEGRVVSLLEGGYNLSALSQSVKCHLQALLRQTP